MAGKSAQASMEYLMIAGFVTLVIIPTTFLFYSYASDSAEEIDRAQIEKFGMDVVSTAETVYYLGYPSHILIEEQLPKNVQSISVEQDPVTGTYLFAIAVNSKSGIVNMTFPTTVRISGDFGPDAISPGQKSVRIYAAPNIDGSPFVAINLENSSCESNIIMNLECSPTQLLSCFNGVLITNCAKCGCSELITVTSVDPSTGPVTGGTPVLITGSNFVAMPAPTVLFGGVASPSVTFESNTLLSVVTPAGAVGIVDIKVINRDGASYTKSNAFTYVPPPTISSISLSIGIVGTTPVTITGTNFFPTTTVKFGSTSATVNYIDNAHLQATAPDNAVGFVDVVVTNPDGQLGTLSSGFLYRPDPVPAGTVFVTSLTYQGSLPGLAGGDSNCQALANAGGFGGTWKAWLSTAIPPTPAVNAKDRIPDTTYQRLDGVVVAVGKADLLDRSLSNPISITDTGVSASGNVWTGTMGQGTPAGYDCLRWLTSVSGNPFDEKIGTYGQAGSASNYWTYAGYNLPCGNQARLYCFRIDKPNGAPCSADAECSSGYCYVDEDGDRYAPASGTKICQASSPLTGTDCNDADASKWQNLMCYPDRDGDTYGVGSGQSICSGASCPSGYASRGGDCYDSNANAKPGQTQYFPNNRGDGSFDYDCDGQQTKQLNCQTNYPADGCYYPTRPTGISGWTFIPACGAYGTFKTCSTDFSTTYCGAAGWPSVSCSNQCLPGRSWRIQGRSTTQYCR